MATNTITSTTPVYHTATGQSVTAVFSGPFRGASIRVYINRGTSPETYQPLPSNDGGLVTEPKAFNYICGTGTILKFQAINIGSPIPSINLVTKD